MASLNFKGKTAVWNHHLSVPYHTLDKDKKSSLAGAGEHENMIIEGDNLLALKALLPKYQGKVKCIYIDPPYNTGNEGWVYNDNVSSPVIQDWLGQTVGKEGEDLTRHDKWLCMMTPRLKLLRELLAEDGVIFISIDDIEQSRLKILLDEVFGDKNFLTTLIWKSRQIVDSRNINKVSNDHEYILVYGKNDTLSFKGKPSDIGKYSNPDNDERGIWMSNSILGLANESQRPNLHYPIIDPKTGQSYSCPKDTGWRYSKETMKGKIEDSRIIFPRKVEGRPREKKFFSELADKNTGFSTILNESVGYTLHGTREVREILDDDTFPFPKPVSLIKTLMQQVTFDKDVILDSFAGSGTTAQAILELNKEDGGDRKYILVETESYANKTTAERVRRVIKRDKLDVGFTYYTLGPSINARDILKGKDLPSWESFAKYVHYLATGKPIEEVKKPNATWEIVSGTKHTRVYCLYKDTLEGLKTLALTRDWLDLVQDTEGKKIVYAPACFIDKDELDARGISFVQIPFALFQRK